MNDEGAPYDSGLDDTGPFADTPPPGGVSLESALREFGPAAIEDLIPRLRAVAVALDEAHDAGFVHGRLHPSKVIVIDDATFLMGRRLPADLELTPEADQFALAGIAYQWMFGRPTTGPADRPVAVRAVPGVDRGALSQAFTRALSPEPSSRFASCEAFVDAIAATLIPSLPFAAADPDEDPVEPFVPESEPFTADAADLHPLDAPLSLEGIDAAIAPPDYGSSARRAAVSEARTHEPEEPVIAPPAFASTTANRSERFGGTALIIATLVGAVFGFAAGYMARPRALQVSEAQQSAIDVPARTATPEPPAPVAATPSPSAPPASASAPTESSEPRRTSPPAPGSEAPPVPKASPAPKAPVTSGRLLVRSTPSGASVEVDGVARGVTPLALTLELGTREITVTRRGYVPERSRVVLTQARPSRSVEIRLTAQRAEAPASAAKPAVTTGGLTIESRPTGAAVTLNGKPSGITPLTINDLAPGEYRVMMRLAGHRDFATTVRVVAGERARAAARLTEQEQE